MVNNNFKIAESIITSYEARIKVIQAIAEDTTNLLEEFRNRREKMSHELKGALAQHESLRKKDFEKMMEDILIAQKKREENVKQMLVNFQEEEMAVIKNFRKMLKKGKKLRLKDFKRTLDKIREKQEAREKEGKESSGRIQTELTQMQSEVKEMLENFRKEREKVALEWRKITAVMAQKKRRKKE